MNNIEFQEHRTFVNNNETEVLLVTNGYGDGMLFKYDLVDGKRDCYCMLTIGNICAHQVRELIEKYDHYEQL